MVNTDIQIYLASASPRRRELLEQIGIRYGLLAVDVDESRLPGEAPSAYVERLALEKARAGRKILETQHAPMAPVLGADTAVVLGDRILGKPRDEQDAKAMLQALSGHAHQVMSAVALVEAREETRLNISEVKFRQLDATEIEAYCRTGEPLDKAGSYGIQGQAAVFVESLQGSYSGVMGLPLYETGELLQQFAIKVL
jgi:septum formation protein